MKFNSGFGYDNKAKKFTAPDEVWDAYCQAHPKDAYLRHGTCPDYEDLEMAVGNGVAVGKNSIGLGSATDARTLGADENRVPHIEELNYDAENEAFRRAPAKRSRGQFEINSGHTENSSHQEFMAEIKKITTTIEGVQSLLVKRDTMLEKKEREKTYTTWDAIKEIPDLTEDVRTKAFDLLDTKSKKDGFLRMTVDERKRWITYKIREIRE
ncbi:uncharacterized protein At2g29880-like [Salvia miltiorrhiza]|uniref:uncharacterized protein At2g29880-like n=1 Tax=Salvia miltiorrhiza TaxID=226208 RepID=UPI0025ACE2A1|nr:uncharacterized protein At2g29880-like [Salvia miltiorrhiza]